MEVKFENTTKYNKKVYEDFLKFHSEKYSMKYIIYTCTISLILIYIIIFAISYKNWKSIFSLILCLIIFVFYRIYSQKQIIKKEINSSKIKEEEQFTFKFYDKKITVNKGTQVEKLAYKKIYRAFEVEKYFYLYIDKTHAFILEKSGFINLDNTKFKKFLKERLKRKFKY